MGNGKDRNYQLIKNFLSSRYTACSSTGFLTPWPIYTPFSILSKVLYLAHIPPEFQSFPSFGPNVSIRGPASSKTSDNVCQSSRSIALRHSICILGGTAAWQGRGVFDVLWDPWDVQDAARTFGKHSTATDYKLPERFKAWKEWFLMVHVICWEKAALSLILKPPMISLVLCHHTSVIREAIASVLCAPNLSILSVWESCLCLAYTWLSVYLRRRVRSERKFRSISELLKHRWICVISLFSLNLLLNIQ